MTIDTVDNLDEMRARACAVADDGNDEYWRWYLDNARTIREADERAGLMTVPTPPTDAMIGAFHDAIRIWMAEKGNDEDVFRAMLAASPFAPKVTK